MDISFFFLSLIILFPELVLRLLVAFPCFVPPPPKLQQTHLASIEYLQQKWQTDVWALLCFSIVISYYWKKKMRSVTKESGGISWLAMPLKLKNISREKFLIVKNLNHVEKYAFEIFFFEQHIYQFRKLISMKWYFNFNTLTFLTLHVSIKLQFYSWSYLLHSKN